MLTEAVTRAQLSLDALWRDPPHPPHVLHGDIQTGNVMVERGRVILIDFQDLIWGFEIQDALIALRGLEHSAEVPELKAAFRSGYETVRPWPEADDEVVAALRASRALERPQLRAQRSRPGPRRIRRPARRGRSPTGCADDRSSG